MSVLRKHKLLHLKLIYHLTLLLKGKVYFIHSASSRQITTVDEAKKFYPLFGLAENVLIFSGQTVKYFASLRSSLAPGVDAWAISPKQMISIVVLMDKKRWHYKACCTAFISSIFYLYS